jgi:hypothetical protein
MTGAADELEAIRELKARYCRFLDTRTILKMSSGDGA